MQNTWKKDGGECGAKSSTNEEAAYARTGDYRRYWLRNKGIMYVEMIGTDRGLLNPIPGYCLVGQHGVDVDYRYPRVDCRPALNLDLGKVIFASKAADSNGVKSRGSDGLAPVGTCSYNIEDSGESFKLTLLDESRSGFRTGTAQLDGDTLTVPVSGAAVGDHEYVSAVIFDKEGEMKYYGRVADLSDASSGSMSVSIDLSETITTETDKMYLFSEQYNGDYLTDYASPFSEVKGILLPNKTPVISFEGGREDVAGSMPYFVLDKLNDEYTVPENTGFTIPEEAGLSFIGWKAEGSEGRFLPGTELEPDSDIVFTAEWGKSWSCLQAQIDAVPDGGSAELKLEEDLYASLEDTWLIIPEGKHITIDLNGFRLDRNKKSVCSTLYKNRMEGIQGGGILVRGELILTDSSAEGNGSIIGGSGDDIYSEEYFEGGGVTVDGGSFIMNAGRITDNFGSSGGVSVLNGGSFVMNGGVIDKNNASAAGGAFCVSGEVTINGGLIADNEGNGGGINVFGGTLTVNGGKITGNRGLLNGGVLVLGGDHDCTFKVSGSAYIAGNYAKWSDGETSIMLNEGEFIEFAGPLTEEARLSVTMNLSEAFWNEEGSLTRITEGMNGQGSLENFVVSDDRYDVLLNENGEVVFGPKASIIYYIATEDYYEEKIEKSLRGMEVVLPECTLPIPDDMVFEGWSDGETEALYKPGDVFTVTDEYTMFSAAGTKAVTVSFHPVGGVGEMAPVRTGKNRMYTLPENEFTNPDPDYVFNGWMIGDDPVTVYQPGDSVLITGDTTVWANWVAVEWNLFVSGVQVNGYCAYDVLGDGGSVQYDSLTNTLTLTDAEISLQERSDGVNPGTAFGIRYGINRYTPFHLVLNGNNIITDVGAPSGLQGKYGIGIYNANNTRDCRPVISGSGSLEISLHSDCNTVGIHSAGSVTTVEGARILVEMDGAGGSERLIECCGNHLFLTGGAILNVKTLSSDSNAHLLQDVASIDIEEGTKLLLSGGASAFSEQTELTGRMKKINAVVSTEASGENAEPWDRSTPLTAYRYIRFPDSHEHVWDGGVVTTEPTCTEPGVRTFTCALCDDTRTEEIEPLGHDWGEPTYTWSDDNQEVTATRVCLRDPSHIDTETVPSVILLAKGATPKEAGEITYMAMFTNSAFTAQTKVVEGDPPTGITEPEFVSRALLLGSQIGVMFKMELPKNFGEEDAYMTFAYSNGRGMIRQTLSEATKLDGENIYWFKCDINALELADDIVATFHYGDKSIQKTYSAMKYINYVKSHFADREKLIDLVNALQNYGHYLQESGWTDNKTHAEIPAASDLDDSRVAAAREGVSGMAVEKNITGSGVSGISYSLTLNCDTVINLIATLEDSVTITSPDNYKEITSEGITSYRFTTEGIGAGNLNKIYTFTIETSAGQAEVKASAMSYVYSVLNSSDFTDAKKYAMAAYYEYAQAAQAY